MITLSSVQNNYEFRGLSTDAKPDASFGMANGSVFFEMDTGKAFMWDAEHKNWIQL